MGGAEQQPAQIDLGGRRCPRADGKAQAIRLGQHSVDAADGRFDGNHIRGVHRRGDRIAAQQGGYVGCETAGAIRADGREQRRDSRG